MRIWKQDEHQTMYAISLLKLVVVVVGGGAAGAGKFNDRALCVTRVRY
jgi:glycerol-3-phosphate dehydrogenase